METIKNVVKIENMRSSNGNLIPNQFVIDTEEATYFQSYNSVIVKAPKGEGKTQLDKSKWDYSKTTGKYRNMFLLETKKETEKKIETGVYELVDLN